MLTEEQIAFLNSVCPYRWAETNGVISVVGNVDIRNMYLTQIPVQFGRVTGFFDCSFNKLTNLIGGPSIVEEGYFECEYNQLTTLVGGPKDIGHGYYSCNSNKLTNLIGAPKLCNNSFYCESNQLTSLEGCPIHINANLFVADNINLKLLFHIGAVRDNVYCNALDDLNAWIIKMAKLNIFFKSKLEIIKYTKENNYRILKEAPQKIRQMFSKYELDYIDNLC